MEHQFKEYDGVLELLEELNREFKEAPKVLLIDLEAQSFGNVAL